MGAELVAVIVVVVALALAGVAALTLTTVIVPPGTLALLLKRGKATRRALEPGRHFLPPWRKAMLEVYPSRELTLVVGGSSSPDPRVEASDDPLRLHFGDRTFAEVKFTVRMRLDTSQLREVHNRFGPEGIWPAFRDITRDTVIAEVGERALSVDDAFGAGFNALEERLETRLTATLGEVGFGLTMFTLREIDLGETGEVIQATLRADREVEREGALAKLRAARLENDAALSAGHEGVDGAMMLRYRQLEVWRELLERWDGDRPIPPALTVAMTAAPPASNHLADVGQAEAAPDTDGSSADDDVDVP